MDLSFEIQAKYDQLNKAQEELEHFSKQYDDLAAQLRDGKIDAKGIEDFQKTLNEAYDNMERAAQKMGEVTSRLSSEDGIRLATDLMGKYSATIDVVRENTQKLSAEVDKVGQMGNSGLAEGAKSLSEDLQIINLQVDDLSAKIDTTTKSLNLQQAGIEESKKAFKDAVLSVEEYQTNLANLSGSNKQQMHELATMIDEDEKQIEAAAQRIEDLQKRNTKLGNDVEFMQSSGNAQDPIVQAQIEMKQNQLAANNAAIEQARVGIANYKNEISACSQRMIELGNEATNTATKSSSIRTQMRMARQQVAQMIIDGKQNTAEFGRAVNEANKLSAAFAKAGMAISGKSLGFNAFNMMSTSIQGLTGAMTTYMGVASLFTDDQERLQEVQKNLQSVMAVSMGVQQMITAATQISVKWDALKASALAAVTASEEAATAAGTANAASNTAVATSSGAATAATGAQSAANVVEAGTAAAGTAANWSLAAAFRAVGAAIMSIPVFGWILAGVTALIALGTALWSKINEVSQATKDMNDVMSEISGEFDKATNEAQMWYDKMNAAAEGSDAQREAVEKLTGICEEYGVTIDEEGNKIDILNAKREQLIDLIKREAIEREKSALIEGVQKKIDAQMEDVGEKIKDELKDIKGISEGEAEVMALDFSSRMQQMGRELENFSDKSGITWREFADKYGSEMRRIAHNNGLFQGDMANSWISDRDLEKVKLLAELAKEAGISYNDAAQKFGNTFLKGIGYIEDIRAKQGEVISNLNETSNAMGDVDEQTKYATMSADELYEALKQSENGTTPAVDDVEIRNATASSDDLNAAMDTTEEERTANVSDSKIVAAQGAASALDSGLTGIANKRYVANVDVNINFPKEFGGSFSATGGSGYTRENDPILKAINGRGSGGQKTTYNAETEMKNRAKSLQERAKKATNNRERNAVKKEAQELLDIAPDGSSVKSALTSLVSSLQNNGRSGSTRSHRSGRKSTGSRSNSGKDEAARMAENLKKEQQDRAEDEAEWAVEAQNAISEASISALIEGREKEREERELQHKKDLQDIKDQERDFKKANYEHSKKIFENTAANKGKKYSGTIEGQTLTADQQKILDAQTTKVENEYRAWYEQRKKEDLEIAAKYGIEAEKQRKEQIKTLKEDIKTLEDLIDTLSKAHDKEGLEFAQSALKMAQSQMAWVESGKAAWNEYLSKYGTFLEKRKALDEQFAHDTEGMDKNSPEYLTKKKEYDANASSLRLDEIKNGMDWAQAFGDLSVLNSKTLVKLKDDLRKLIDEDERLSQQDKTQLIEQYNKLNEAIIKEQDTWFGAFKFWETDEQKKLRLLREELELKKQVADANLEKAQTRYNEAKKNKEDAAENMKSARLNLATLAAENGETLTQEDLDDIIKNGSDSERGKKLSQLIASGRRVKRNMSGKEETDLDTAQDTELQGNLTKAMDAVKSADTSLTQATSELGTAQSGLTEATENAEKTDKDLEDTGSGAAAMMAKVDNVVNGINKNVQSLNNFLKELGGEDTAFGKGLNSFAQSVQGVTDAWSSLKSGDLAGVAKGVYEGVAYLGDAIELWLGADEWGDYEDAVENLNAMSSLWDTLIEKKKEYAEISFGDNKRALLEDALTAQNANTAAIQETALKYNNANTWRTHSARHTATKAIGSDTFKKMSAAIGKNIKDVNDLLYLTNEELTTLMSIDEGKWWAKLDDTQRDYLQQIMDANDAAKDLQDSLNSTFAGVTFDDMVSSFADSIKDMSATAEDFVSDFEGWMRDAIIENTVLDGAEDKLKEIYSKYQELAEQQSGKLTAAQTQAFKDELRKAAEYYYDVREEIIGMYGLDENEAETQQKNAYATASEDSIEELSGRMLANNEALYSIRALLTAPLTEYAPAIVDNTSQMSGTLRSIYSALQLQQELRENSFLELQTISTNTGRTASVLSDMNTEITKIRKRIDNI